MASPPADPEVEGFLALLAARRSPRTVDAYRRDLAALVLLERLHELVDVGDFGKRQPRPAVRVQVVS